MIETIFYIIVYFTISVIFSKILRLLYLNICREGHTSDDEDKFLIFIDLMWVVSIPLIIVMFISYKLCNSISDTIDYIIERLKK